MNDTNQMSAVENASAVYVEPDVLQEAADASAALIASLQAELAILRNQVSAPEVVKVPVEDAALAVAIASLEHDAKVDLAGERVSDKGNPLDTRATPDLTLHSKLGVYPELTVSQRKVWTEAKKGIIHAYSAFHRAQLGKRRALLTRIVKDARGVISTSGRETSKGALSVSIRGKLAAKPRKGAGMKKAKPAQIAAKVPAAGNAQTPAFVS